MAEADSEELYSFEEVYAAYDALLAEKAREMEDIGKARNALQKYLRQRSGNRARDGFVRMQQCRDALDALDRQGWQRSFHQRMFHENFIRACARVFFKTEPQGAFARAHQGVLDLNGWDNLSQEILISTPRRSAPLQPGPSHLPRSSNASHPVEGMYRGASWSPLTRTQMVPRRTMYLGTSAAYSS